MSEEEREVNKYSYLDDGVDFDLAQAFFDLLTQLNLKCVQNLDEYGNVINYKFYQVIKEQGE